MTLTLLCTAAPAHAYMGPGLGLGAIGVVLGVVGSILLGIVSIIWYPVKRLIRSLRQKSNDRERPGKSGAAED